MAATKAQIYQELLGRIVEGKLPPRAQLPTRTELQATFGAGPMTVQAAVDVLRRHGFVEARRGHGTHVAAYPPHLYQYALCFPRYPGPTWPRFWTALDQEAAALPAPRRIQTFYGVDGHPDRESYRSLLAHIRSRRLAGIIFSTAPHELEQTPLLDETDIPRVALTLGFELPGISVVHFDFKSFIDRALDHLARQGRTRVAILTQPTHTAAETYETAFADGVAARGMTTRPYWRMRVTGNHPGGAHDFMHLLMQPHQHDRPDALIITDDNLVEAASAGLVAAGARVPEELSIVAHCNFPWPAPSVVPMQRLGFDARVVLEGAIEQLDAARANPGNAAPASVPAVFEEEVSAPEPSPQLSLPPKLRFKHSRAKGAEAIGK